jgi:hypothetical protein
LPLQEGYPIRKQDLERARHWHSHDGIRKADIPSALTINSRRHRPVLLRKMGARNAPPLSRSASHYRITGTCVNYTLTSLDRAGS